MYKEFTPDYLKKQYGDHEVQLYDNLFNLSNIITLREYIDTYFQEKYLSKKLDTKFTIPYVRWYSKLKDYEFIWSDNFFKQIKSYWTFPYFLPTENYLLPQIKEKKYCLTKELFPGKAIFISAKNAKTRLHYDPWCSDAVLCQVYGIKKIVMYAPWKKEFLCKDNECVDIDKPDYSLFPQFRENNNPSFTDVLNPGEIIYFPNNWLHHVTTLTDSISLTWNFVHITTSKAFLNYLIHNPKAEELEVIKFFTNNINY